MKYDEEDDAPSMDDVFGDANDAPDDSPAEDEDMAGDDDVPPEFESAYDEYQDNPTAKTMYAMIQACHAGGAGLDVIIGGGKKK